MVGKFRCHGIEVIKTTLFINNFTGGLILLGDLFFVQPKLDPLILPQKQCAAVITNLCKQDERYMTYRFRILEIFIHSTLNLHIKNAILGKINIRKSYKNPRKY